MEDSIKAIMADIFMIDTGSIDQQSSMDTIERWDSLAHIDLVAALEEEFGLAFEVEEFESMTSYGEIVRVVNSKQ